MKAPILRRTAVFPGDLSKEPDPEEEESLELALSTTLKAFHHSVKSLNVVETMLMVFLHFADI